MGYNERLGDKLHKEDLQRFIRKNPSTKNVRYKADMHGPGDPRYYKKKRSDAGTIDFHHYGGKKSKETKWEEMITGAKYWGKKKDKDKLDRTRKDWSKVAKELGIDNVDSEEKVLRMIEHVRGGRAMAKEEEPVAPPVEQPPTFVPSEGHQDARDDFENTRDNPVPRMSDQPGMADNTSNPYLSAITHGDDLNDWYTEFVKGEKAEARLAAHEIGERTRFHVGRFDGKVPELADAGELYQDWNKKI